jgi:hypothetical protein
MKYTSRSLQGFYAKHGAVIDDLIRELLFEETIPHTMHNSFFSKKNKALEAGLATTIDQAIQMDR